jgi:uncharacterized membrane protein YdbT with pleckstrin-like domain
MSASQETTVWSGSPSQLRNLGLYLLCVLVAIALLASAGSFAGISRTITFALLLLPIGIAAWRWVVTMSTRYTLTDQRLILRRGVFGRSTDYVELYRVKDSHYTQSFFERLLGLGTITLRTTQDSAALVVLAGMSAPESLWNQIRGLVEARRDAKGVREVDMNTESGG